jgi:hypothetical protein
MEVLRHEEGMVRMDGVRWWVGCGWGVRSGWGCMSRKMGYR